MLEAELLSLPYTLPPSCVFFLLPSRGIPPPSSSLLILKCQSWISPPGALTESPACLLAMAQLPIWSPYLPSACPPRGNQVLAQHCLRNFTGLSPTASSPLHPLVFLRPEMYGSDTWHGQPLLHPLALSMFLLFYYCFSVFLFVCSYPSTSHFGAIFFSFLSKTKIGIKTK